METRTKALREVIVFLVLTAVLSTLAYLPIIRAGSISGANSNLAVLLMLAPGLAALVTYLIFERSLRPVGWSPGPIQYLILGLAIPVIYCLAAYGLVWLTGWGRYNGQIPSGFLVALATLLFSGTLSAALEEIGWRGLLVPKMMKLMGFTGTALISGLIWAVWHYPLILFSDVRPENSPVAFSLVCFTFFVVGLSFVAAWLRMKSGSMWTAALLHGSHNALMLHVFNLVTTDTGRTWLLLGEYGAVTAAAGLVLAVVFWSQRGRLPARTYGGA